MKTKSILKPDDEAMIKRIVELVAEQTYIPVKDILGKSRREDIVDSRHLCWFFAVKHGGLPITAAARHFGVHHGAVIYALEKLSYRILLHRNKKMERDMHFIAKELKCAELAESLEVNIHDHAIIAGKA